MVITQMECIEVNLLSMPGYMSWLCEPSYWEHAEVAEGSYLQS